VTGQLGAVIGDDDVRSTTLADHSVQLPCHPGAGQGCVDDDRQRFPAEVVDDTQGPEAPVIRQRIRDEVKAPLARQGMHGMPERGAGSPDPER